MSRKDFSYTTTSYAPTPTKNTLFWRKFWPWQAWRFIVLNLKIMKMVVKGHS